MTTQCARKGLPHPTVSITLPGLLGDILTNATLYGQGKWWSTFPDWHDLDLGVDWVPVLEIQADSELAEFPLHLIHRVTREMVLEAFDKLDPERLGRILAFDGDMIDIDALLQTAVFGKVIYA